MALDIVELDLFKYRSEDFSLSLPVLNTDGTVYNFPALTKAKCTFKKVSGDGTLETFSFSTVATNITVSGNTLVFLEDHAVLDGIVGQYTGEVLVNIPPSDTDIVLYVLNLNCVDGNTVNNTW